jgi:SAM-dependent methyltransferase
MPTEAELEEFYQTSYRESYKGVRQPKRKHTYRAGVLAIERASRLGTYLHAGADVLDVGCASGEFLYVLDTLGHHPTGIEPDPQYGEFARKEYGVRIVTGCAHHHSFPNASFDLVTLFHVLEHVPNPQQVLERVRDWTKDSGCIAIEVPSAASQNQHPAKRFHYAHVLGFTEASLKRCLESSGWSVNELSGDSDDRNLFAVAVKHGASAQVSPGPADREPPSLPKPASVRDYYLRQRTYVRWFRRMLRFAWEYAAVRGGESPREMVLSLIRAKSLKNA